MANEKLLIDANALKESVMKEIRHYWNEGEGGYHLAEDVIPDIENAPTVDAVEVVHGRWLIARSRVDAQFKCSECGYSYIDADSNAMPEFNYCPNCGAKMKGES